MAAVAMVWFLMLPVMGLIFLVVLGGFAGSIWEAVASKVRSRYWERTYTEEQIESEKERNPEFDETRVEVFNPEYDDLLSRGHVLVVAAYRADDKLDRWLKARRGQPSREDKYSGENL